MIRFIRRFVFTFNIIAVILLSGSYLSVFISPEESWIFAFLGLAYPVILLINVMFALFWALQFRINAVVSIAAILAGASFFQQTFQFHTSEQPSDSSMRIVSYNAGLFGYFQSRWHVPEMIGKVNEIRPDVLCVQEVLNLMPKDQPSTIDTIMQECGFKYVYFQKLEDGRKRGQYGMAIFSKYRILRGELVHFDGLTGNMCIYADMSVGDTVYRFYSVHLQSFKFRKQDYKFVKQLPHDNDEKIRQSKSILNRMKYAYSKRASQVDKVRAHIAGSKHSHFVIGDFNDPPVSYSYATMRRGLRDAFVENGFGMGRTYIGMMPNFRIDYILYPTHFTGLSYNAYKLSSDHSMIATSIRRSEN